MQNFVVLQNGSFLAQSQKVVVVAINYRLNVFGFLPVKMDDGTISANNGFRDQQMAMQWYVSYLYLTSSIVHYGVHLQTT